METKTFYNEVLTDHNMHPYHKHDIDNADLELEGVNPSCGDDIILKYCTFNSCWHMRDIS